MQKRKRAVKYRRVSTKEQALKGYSLDAQDETLEQYAKLHDLEIVGDYVDDGYSASSIKRPALTRLLEDIELGGIDLIIFTKLDRWFRSVPLYYKIQDKLDEHGIPWRAALEQYSTETSDEKFKVNIMLSVAQNEIDRTKERINEVFKHKLSEGQAISGSQPLGYMIKDKKIVKDPKTEHIVNDIFDIFEKEQCAMNVMKIIREKHNFNIAYGLISKTLSNVKYTGLYRGMPNYYPQYISTARYENIQQIKSKNIKKTPSNNDYIFSRLLKCGNCGYTLVGSFNVNRYGTTYFYYRCNNAQTEKNCTQTHKISEKKFEKVLLNVIEERTKDYIFQVDAIEEEQSEINPEDIKAEMERLNAMYRKGRISEEIYDFEYEELQAQLESISKPQKLNKNIEKLLESNFINFYTSLPSEDKRLVWRSVIDKIIVRTNTDFDIEFL